MSASALKTRRINFIPDDRVVFYEPLGLKGSGGSITTSMLGLGIEINFTLQNFE